MKKILVACLSVGVMVMSSPGGFASSTYTPISSHTWALIAKDPNAHKGAHIQVYGQIDQFDTFTGTKQFLGDTDGVNDFSDGFWYSTFLESLLVGSSSMFSQFVRGDIYKANVTVLGTYTYNTKTGHINTIVKLGVKSITYLASGR